MRKISILPLVLLLGSLVVSAGAGHPQGTYLSEFLKNKKEFGEKLVVIYAPENRQDLLNAQVELLSLNNQVLKNEKIAVVRIPVKLSPANRAYLEKNLRIQKDRLNVWVFDENGYLRMSGSKVTSLGQILRVLDIQSRPNAYAKAQSVWE